MRNKFTKQAQTALTLAKAAAIDFELGYIGTEHLLLICITFKHNSHDRTGLILQ